MQNEAHEVLLDIRNLCVTFSRQYGFLMRGHSSIGAVDDVSFQICPSETLSLVGESGSGKTTVARCIMKNTIPTSGSIIYGNKDVTKISGEQLVAYRRDVQMIYQDPYESLNPRIDVFTTIGLPLRHLLGEQNKSQLLSSVARLLEEVGLKPDRFMGRLPHELSGGERQRVNIARALAPNPKLLIADEPLTMLDASQRLNILSLLTRIKNERSLTILLITHDLASAKIMSDRTAIMYKGKIVEIGSTNKVLSRPEHQYTRLILESTPRLEPSANV